MKNEFSISGYSIVSINRDVPFSRVHDDMLGINERTGYCYSINASATRVWEIMNEPVSVNDICSVLCREFVVEKEVCFHDLVEFLSDMLKTGLIRVADGEMAPAH